MRRINLALLAAVQLCRARNPGFSIHDDLLAFPQYEVVFSDKLISSNDANALIQDGSRHPTYSADFSQPTAGDAREAAADEADGATDAPLSYTYEVMNMPPQRYLCSIPIIKPSPPENQTANELAKAEEARELSRAAQKGWALLANLEDSCLYYMSGWWSYSFCKNREIVQFHALSASANGQPPRKDPHTSEFVLGKVPMIPATAEHHTQRASSDSSSTPAELQVKGDQRYLVQKLEGGTVCDLTGRERTVEVQYHCVPNIKSDRIGWIKEVTICAYVMVVNTPSLCNDVAFLPPEETKANPISCQLISDGDGAAIPLLESAQSATKDVAAAAESSEASAGKDKSEKSEITIGGVVIGARKVLSTADEAGKPPVKLAPPRGFWAGQGIGDDGLVEVIVRAASKEDGGKVEAPSAEELKNLDIDPEVLEEMKEKLAQMAGDAGWQLEIVEMNGGRFRELRGTVDDGEEGDQGKDIQGGNKAKDKTRAKDKVRAKDRSRSREKSNPKAKNRDNSKDEDDHGSEERFFKDEL
ncbi:Protein OS-9-like protein [Hirsutella minnesotensis 3608]|uniref:Endoplasmic reticulum lectin n=1 Tax=Hirsutella minnesotensis 3608 TaxID=1043627 RepID=A0A0F7ZMB8_9HYPO|nr:Protein OS-9-like protein [Hirsutella minnesotensis 3608]